MPNTKTAVEPKPSKKYRDNNTSGFEGEALDFHVEKQHRRLNDTQLQVREAISKRKMEIAAAKTASEPDYREIVKLQNQLALFERELDAHNKLEKELF